MGEQDIPDWLQALRPTESPAESAEPSDIPDWLREMQPRELGPGAPPVSDFPEPEALPEPEAPPEPESTIEEAEPPSPPSEFELLRQKAASQQAEYEEEEQFREESPILQAIKGSAIAQLVGTLQPWQRFTVTLLLFLNISTLGFFILLILGRIYFGP